MTTMICPKANECKNCKYPNHQRPHEFSQTFCIDAFGCPKCIPYFPENWNNEDVTLQDFYSLLKTRGTNSIVAESELMRKVLEVAPLMAKALEKLQYHPIHATQAKPARHPWGF